jgi:antitoxin ParD1/3/4
VGKHAFSLIEAVQPSKLLIRKPPKMRSQRLGNPCQSSYHDTQVTILVWEGRAAMPTRNVNLTAELDRFVATKIKSGRYENASEVVRAGLRNLERDEQQYELKLTALRAAIDEGDASGIAGGNVFRRVRKKLKLRAAR